MKCKVCGEESYHDETCSVGCEKKLNEQVKAVNCPLCVEGNLEHVQKEQTNIYVCDACSVVMVEWHDKKDSEALVEYLDRPL